MFENLLSTKDNKSDTSMGTMNINSETAGLQQVDTNGSALIDTAEELEEREVESSTRTTEEGEVIELSDSGEPIGESDLMRDSLSISADSAENSSFFTDEELSEIRKHEQRFRDSELESIASVREAIDDPSIPANNRRELYQYCLKKENKGPYSEDKEYPNEEAEMLDEIGDKDWVEAENPENKQISEMQGHEFKQLMQEAQNGNDEASEEELSQETEPQEEPDLENVPEELATEAASVWEERGGIWAEFSEDISIDVSDTQVSSISEDKKEIKTMNTELQKELVKAHKSDKWDTTLKKENGVYVATIPKGIEL